MSDENWGEKCPYYRAKVVHDRVNGKSWEGHGTCELNDKLCEKEAGNFCTVYEEEVRNV